MDTGCLDGFLEGHGRQNGGDAFRQHGFAGAGRANEQDVVAAGTRHLECTLGGLLAVHVAHVHGILRGLIEQLVGVNMHGMEGFGRIDQIYGLRQGFQGKYVDAVDDGRFLGIVFGNSHRFHAIGPGGNGGGKRSAHGTHGAIEGEFAEEHHAIDQLAEELSLAADQAERHGQIECGTFLAQIGGREVYGNALAIGEFVSTIAQRGFDALAAFLYGIVGQANHVEVLDPSRADVDLDGVSVDVVHGCANSLEKHDDWFKLERRQLQCISYM